jgi:NAD(P)-dependent dehydrogenase (short-subunit alcohol dehydrogenase family)
MTQQTVRRRLTNAGLWGHTMKIDFTGKRVFVTGGTRGIGRSIAQAFLEAGARVALHGSSEESVRRAVTEIGASEPVVAAPGVLSTVEGCRQAVETALSGLGGLDVLVNNAGRWNFFPVEAVDEAAWDDVIDVNLKGAFFVTKYALPALRAAKGNIVNIASVSGISAEPCTSIYCVSKAGLIHMTRCHAWEFAPDVRVNAVCPGPIDTEMLRQVAQKFFGTVDEGYTTIEKDCALKRIGRPGEIAGPVLYLASDLAKYVTGCIHVVDGGMSID